jgi:hypothetical protein
MTLPTIHEFEGNLLALFEQVAVAPVRQSPRASTFLPLQGRQLYEAATHGGLHHLTSRGDQLACLSDKM